VSKVNWADLPEEVREPLQRGEDPERPCLEVQCFAKTHMIKVGMAVVPNKGTAWDLLCAEWKRSRGHEISGFSNPWRRAHTRNYWVWARFTDVTSKRPTSAETVAAGIDYDNIVSREGGR
jgi:hypothetical protein